MFRCRSRLPLALAIGCGRSLATILVGAAIIAAVLAIGLTPRRAVSLPLYARQTGQPCATCHTAFLELTPFGRRFKLGGYTLGGGDWTGPPFAVMLQPTFTNTQAAQQYQDPLAPNLFPEVVPRRRTLGSGNKPARAESHGSEHWPVHRIEKA